MKGLSVIIFTNDEERMKYLKEFEQYMNCFSPFKVNYRNRSYMLEGNATICLLETFHWIDICGLQIKDVSFMCDEHRMAYLEPRKYLQLISRASRYTGYVFPMFRYFELATQRCEDLGE